jgi:hypothetical protein
MNDLLRLIPGAALFTLVGCGGATSDGSKGSETTTTSGRDASTGTATNSGADASTGDTVITDGATTTDSGAWFNLTQGTDASGQLWTAVASDSSGDHLVATSTLVIPPGNLISGFWTSTNAGRTWASTTGPAGLGSIASNATGTVLVAAEGISTSGGEIWTSTNSGATWSDRPTTSLRDSWGCVASDSTGTQLFAGAVFGDIWTSSNSGSTWTDQTPSGPAHGQNWVSMASDSTGTNLVAVAGGGSIVAGPGSTGDIWTSSDSGATWMDQTPSGPAHDIYWASVASDSTGTNLIAVGAGIWTSVNAGRTWTQQPAPSITGTWVSVASDSTGTHLVAASGQVGGTGDLWTSSNSGVTWSNQTAGTSAGGQAWSAVASDSTGAHLVAVVRDGDIWTN